MKHTKLSLIFNKPELTGTEQTLLFLVPLVWTAWAHGAISKREKQLIYKAAREDSIDERDPINLILNDLLIYQPGREFFEECLSLIGSRLFQMTVKERTQIREKILKRCREVAAAAGERSPMDVNHHISPEEKLLLERLAMILD